MTDPDFTARPAAADPGSSAGGGGGRPRTVAILGLGLIGGSLARDLSAAGVRVLGHDADPASLDAALSAGAVHSPLGQRLLGIEEADSVVLAVPVDVAPGLLRTLAPALGGATLVTDVGSTKRAVVEAAEACGLGARFVGSHPFAGDHRAGWSASAAGLFRGARVYLTPCPATDDVALQAARELWALCGATPELADAADHDRLMAWASHLPQVASTALALALSAAGIARQQLGRGGRDATRLAAGSPAVWTGIALQNADELTSAVQALEARLAALRAALQAGDEAAVREFFAAGAAWAG